MPEKVRVTMQYHRIVPGKQAGNGKQYPDEKEILTLESVADSAADVPAVYMQLNEAKFQSTQARINAAKNAGSGRPSTSGNFNDDDTPF